MSEERGRLVLSRKKGEKVIITIPPGLQIPPEGVVIELMNAGMKPDKTRISIEAPKSIQVHRAEVAQAIARGEPNKGKRGSRPLRGGLDR